MITILATAFYHNRFNVMFHYPLENELFSLVCLVKQNLQFVAVMVIPIYVKAFNCTNYKLRGVGVNLLIQNPAMLSVGL
jgi:hypothetical protein